MSETTNHQPLQVVQSQDTTERIQKIRQYMKALDEKLGQPRCLSFTVHQQGGSHLEAIQFFAEKIEEYLVHLPAVRSATNQDHSRAWRCEFRIVEESLGWFSKLFEAKLDYLRHWGEPVEKSVILYPDHDPYSLVAEYSKSMVVNGIHPSRDFVMGLIWHGPKSIEDFDPKAPLDPNWYMTHS